MPQDSKESMSLIQLAIENDNIETVYANGFQAAAGDVDVLMVLTKNGKPVQKLNMSYSMAKSMSKGLGDIINSIEKAADIEIKTSDDFTKAIQSVGERI